MTASNGHNGGFGGAMIHSPERPSLAKVQPEQTRAFEPGSIQEAVQLAGLLVKSRLLPDSVQTPEAAFAIIATGRELGLTAMQSLRSIHVIKGKTILSADLVAALVKSRRDVCAYFQLVESTTERATYRTQRVGEPEPTTLTFTMEDAKRAQVTGNPNWTKYPAAMLRARCITALARAVYPDLAMGVYDPDEIASEPVAPPQPYVVAEPEATPSRNEETFRDLCAAVDAAEVPGQLNVIARHTQKAHAAGLISDEHREAIAKAVKAKRKLFEPPAPPASDPGPMPETAEEVSR